MQLQRCFCNTSLCACVCMYMYMHVCVCLDALWLDIRNRGQFSNQPSSPSPLTPPAAPLTPVNSPDYITDATLSLAPRAPVSTTPHPPKWRAMKSGRTVDNLRRSTPSLTPPSTLSPSHCYKAWPISRDLKC